MTILHTERWQTDEYASDDLCRPTRGTLKRRAIWDEVQADARRMLAELPEWRRVALEREAAAMRALGYR